MNVGKSLKIALAQRELSQTELAIKMGVDRQNISNIANKTTASGTTIERISKALGMTSSEFIALGE